MLVESVGLPRGVSVPVFRGFRFGDPVGEVTFSESSPARRGHTGQCRIGGQRGILSIGQVERPK